jgi:hypothetical protein
MNSPKNLNYETRPAKFTERKMLLSSFLRICNLYGGNYQYIGLGGVSFTDFKLFHKELHIDQMYSLEGGSFSYEKLQVNLPFSFIEIFKEQTTMALEKIDLNKKTIIWLDYDDALKPYMFEDLEILLKKLPIGSIYLMSCNRELKNDETRDPYTVDEFRIEFENQAPFQLAPIDFSASEGFKLIRKMLLNSIDNTIKDREQNNEENLKFQQLYNFLYQENRGAKMYTFGGVIVEKEKTIQELNLNDFDFIKEFEDPYRIEIPNLTSKEIDLINKNISNEEKLEEIIDKGIVTRSEITKHKKTYKYLPNFYDVRI